MISLSLFLLSTAEAVLRPCLPLQFPYLGKNLFLLSTAEAVLRHTKTASNKTALLRFLLSTAEAVLRQFLMLIIHVKKILFLLSTAEAVLRLDSPLINFHIGNHFHCLPLRRY